MAAMSVCRLLICLLKMSSLLRIGRFKSFKNICININRCYFENLVFSPLFRINYFIPRTQGNFGDLIPKARRLTEAPEDFEIIYVFPYDKLLHFAPVSALIITTFATVFHFASSSKDLEVKSNDESSEEVKTEDKLNAENLSVMNASQEISKLGSHLRKSMLLKCEEPKVALALMSAFTAAMLILRMKVVLTISRRKDLFISTFFKPFSARTTGVEHMSQDCHYYPNRQLFRYELYGRKIFISHDLFRSTQDQGSMCTVKNDV